MNTAFGDLKTARQIAKLSAVPLHRVDYAIQRLGLTEAARVGIVRLYEPDQIDVIRQTLADIASHRRGVVRSAEGSACPRT